MATIITNETPSNLNIHDLILPGIKLALRNLEVILQKASEHIKTNSLPESYFTTDARLADDMFALPLQVHSLCNTAKFLVVRAANAPDTLIYQDKKDSTLSELQERVSATLKYIEAVKKEQFDDPDFLSGKKGETKAGGGRFIFKTGLEYVSEFVVPNFYFHHVMVYAILRHKGLEIGKLDYLAAGLDEFGQRTGDRLRKFDW